MTNEKSLRVALGLLGDAMNHGPSEPVFALIAEARDTIESALRDEPKAPPSSAHECVDCGFMKVDADEYRAFVNRPTEPKAEPGTWIDNLGRTHTCDQFDCQTSCSTCEAEPEPIRALIEHIDKVGHIYGYEQIFERARAALNRPAEPRAHLTYAGACNLLVNYAIALQDRQCCGDEMQPQYLAALKACTDAMGVQPENRSSS